MMTNSKTWVASDLRVEANELEVAATLAADSPIMPLLTLCSDTSFFDRRRTSGPYEARPAARPGPSGNRVELADEDVCLVHLVGDDRHRRSLAARSSTAVISSFESDVRLSWLLRVDDNDRAHVSVPVVEGVMESRYPGCQCSCSRPCASSR